MTGFDRFDKIQKAMAELVTIPIAIVEVACQYARPNMQLLMDRAKVVAQLFEVYSAWNVTVDDVEVITQGKPSEQGVKFKIPSRRASFFFGAASARLTWDDANWETADEIIRILLSSLEVLVQIGNVKISSFKTAVALHLQPKSKPFVEILKPFLPAKLAAIDKSAITGAATVIRWGEHRITLDGSSQLANGLFVRFEREFGGDVPFDVIARQLKGDEDELFEMLDVHEDLQ